MLVNVHRYLAIAGLAFGVILGGASTPVEASQVSQSLVQPAQYYGLGPSYYRGPPRGYYGSPYYGPRGYGYGPRPGFYGPGRGFYGLGRGFYGRPHYGRRFYR